MAIIVNQAAIAAADSQHLVTVPPGGAVITLSVPGTNAASVYLGTSDNVTTDNGFVLIAGGPPLTVPGFPGSAATDLWVIGTTGDVVSWIISTTG